MRRVITIEDRSILKGRWRIPNKEDRRDKSARNRGAKVIFVCPSCGMPQCLIDHTVLDQGNVFPAVVCPNPRCLKGFNLRLNAFDEDYLPTKFSYPGMPKKRNSSKKERDYDEQYRSQLN